MTVVTCGHCRREKSLGEPCVCLGDFITGPSGDNPTMAISSAPSVNPWIELHGYKWTDADSCESWYRSWIARSLPVGTCNCVEHWQGFIAGNPPSFDSAANFFTWGVTAHNFVNARKGLDVWSLDRACEAYGFDLSLIRP